MNRMVKEIQAQWPATVQAIVANTSQMPLGPGQLIHQHQQAIQQLQLPNTDSGLACQAGLWLRSNDHEKSHNISQDLPDATGAFWHGILHRREPDAWNAKYWFRRVGNHPVQLQLREHASSLGYTYRSAEIFVDFCEQVRNTQTDQEKLAIQIQDLEWNLLFDYYWKQLHLKSEIA